MNSKKIIMLMAILLVIGLIGGLGYGYYKMIFTKTQNPVATMEIEGYGIVKIELYPEMAPNTVANFIRLANRGFYNGLTFHRTIPNFMIQGGDVNGDGTGAPKLSNIQDEVENDEAYSIEGEFVANGFKQNTLKHTEGVISMARGDYSAYGSSLVKEGYNSAGSQFFIMTGDNSQLNGLYAAFGKVIEGIEIIHQIENVEVVTRDSSASEGVDKPVNPPVIKNITIETYGVDYGMPKTQKPFDIQQWFMNNFNTSQQ
ncbi:MAG: peptidylprolyl isomerase [Clostridia bacterium]|nr:peptidylprolyl isomerase [Clostridia bacterium]